MESPPTQNLLQKSFYSLPENQYLPIEDLADLFTDVQLAPVFPDSKTFSDSIPHSPAQKILEAYHQEKSKENFDLKAFVLDNFTLPSDPSKDFKPDLTLPITEHIKKLWPVLTRTPVSEKSSLIPLSKPYVVPGGRFREIYYWDTFFTMLGLKESGEIDLIQSMIDNFTYLLNIVGHIPNGNRSYYASRSQPPFFALMIDILAQEKGENIWKTYGPALKKEYQFWMDGADKLEAAGQRQRRVVKMEDGSVLNYYSDAETGPRAESFKEDSKIAKESVRDNEEVYPHIRAACESGWDFSTRWFEDKKNFHTIRAGDILPVDLNALLYYLEVSLVKVCKLEGEEKEAESYQQKADARKAAMLKYFWDENSQFFYDYDIVNKKIMDVPTLAAVFPLYFNMVEPEKAASVAKRLESDFLKPGGLVTTLNYSSQQWDAPNGWAPLQWMSIKGLMNYGHDKLALEVRERWTKLNIAVFKRTGKLTEKYNVEDVTLEAGGGKYPNQDGFGWTNGVLMKLLVGKEFQGENNAGEVSK